MPQQPQRKSDGSGMLGRNGIDLLPWDRAAAYFLGIFHGTSAIPSHGFVVPIEILFLTVLCGLLLLFLTIRAVLALRTGQHSLSSTEPHPGDVLLGAACCGMLAFMGLSSVLQEVKPAAAAATGPGSPWVQATNTLIAGIAINGLIIGIAWAWFGSLRQISPVAQLGLGLRLPWPHIIRQAVIYAAPALCIAMGLHQLSGLLLQMWGMETPSQDAVHVLMGRDGVANQVSMLLLVVIMAPLMEEIICRGLLFGSLRGLLPLPVAVVLSGLLFGALHMNASSFLSLSLLGMTLAVAYHRTKCLWVSILIHALFNFIMSLTAILLPLFVDQPMPEPTP